MGDFDDGYLGTGYNNSEANALGRLFREEDKNLKEQSAKLSLERTYQPSRQAQPNTISSGQTTAQSKLTAISTVAKQEASKPRCITCCKVLPERRNYCEKHYREVLLKYKKDCESYRIAKAKWDNLSEAERNKLDESAEEEMLAINALVVSLAIGGGASFLISQFHNISMWYYLGVFVVSFFAVFTFDSVAIFLGRMLRVVFVGALITLGLAGFVALGDLVVERFFSVDLIERWRKVFFILGGLSLWLAFASEKEGELKSKASGPRMPTMPEP